jgi:ribosomal protein RSM22 (predicted rRNA methylase)
MLDSFVSELAQMIIGDGASDESDLARAAKELSIAFTSGRRGLGDDYFSDERMLDAYVAAFLIPNAAKTIHCLMQMSDLGLIPRKDAMSILDLGTGPGTSVLAASLFFAGRYPDKTIGFAGVEQNRSALTRAHELFKMLGPPNHSFESATKQVVPGTLDVILKDHRFDIVITANLMNEIGEEEGYRLCREIMAGHLSENGALLIIDPALKETTRPLLALRDRLVGEGLARVAAPCLHQDGCPMLAASGRDWCHFYIDWDCPEYLERLDALSGMDHRHLKMSYFVFTRESRVTSHELRKWRVVSSPLVSKGKRELVLCGDNGKLEKVTRLDRNSTDCNRDLDSASRGDVVVCSKAWRIGREDRFEIVKAWDPK